MLVYGVVSAVTGKAVELFLEREPAEAFIADVEQDHSETTALLGVAPVELTASPTGRAPLPPARAM